MNQPDQDYQADAMVSAAKSESEPPQAAARPRLWTVFVSIPIVLTVVIIAQIVAVLLYMAWKVREGQPIREVAEGMREFVSTPMAFILLGLPAQLAIGLPPLVMAYFSPTPLMRRVGLVRGNLPLWAYPIVMIGSLATLALGVFLATLIAKVIPPDPSTAQLYEKMTPGIAVPFVIFIAFAPGFMEEILFRGYLQRRLLQRWSPWLAIFVASLIFGVFHITPHATANAFVIGLWIGILAWRTGSIFPGIACHAFINGIWNIWHIGMRFEVFAESPTPVQIAVAAVIIGGCFLLSAFLVFRQPPADVRDGLLGKGT